MDAQRAGSGDERDAGERETYCDMRSMWKRGASPPSIGAIVSGFQVDLRRVQGMRLSCRESL